MNTSLLFISDHAALSKNLVQDLQDHQLRLDQYEIHHNLEELQNKIQRYSIIVFDVHQKIEHFIHILNKLRAHHHLSFLILSPSEKEQDCLDAFAAGADDYLKKPFIVAECIARIKALSRRSQNSPKDDAILIHENLVVNCLTRQATLADTPLELTNTQFNLLELFLRYPGRVLSKEQLTEYSLGREYSAYDRSIDVHVSHLRHKLNADHHDESWIQTVRGYGYTFIAKG